MPFKCLVRLRNSAACGRAVCPKSVPEIEPEENERGNVNGLVAGSVFPHPRRNREFIYLNCKDLRLERLSRGGFGFTGRLRVPRRRQTQRQVFCLEMEEKEDMSGEADPPKRYAGRLGLYRLGGFTRFQRARLSVKHPTSRIRRFVITKECSISPVRFFY